MEICFVLREPEEDVGPGIFPLYRLPLIALLLLEDDASPDETLEDAEFDINRLRILLMSCSLAAPLLFWRLGVAVQLVLSFTTFTTEVVAVVAVDVDLESDD